MSDIFYQAPDDGTFEEIKANAIGIWRNYDDTFGYASNKVNVVEQFENKGSNYMSIVGMFDLGNRAELLNRVRPQTADRIRQALA